MSLTQERNQAENEYIGAVKDQADTAMAQAPELGDTQQHNTDALTQVNEQADMTNELAKASSQGRTQNRLIEQQQQEKQIQQEKQRQYQQAWQDNRNKQNAKNTAINTYKQFATDEAKRKYELASQRLEQAQANIGNINKIFQGLGVTLSMIPGWGWIAGLAVSGTSSLVSGIVAENV